MNIENQSAVKTDNEQNLEQQIYDFITEKKGAVSFANLQHEFGSNDEEDGYYEIGISEKNLIFWAGLTEDHTNAVLKLLDDKRILMTDAHPIVYLVDGIGLSIPVAKTIPKNGYKNPHWIPSVLWTTEQARELSRRGKFDEEYVEKYREEGYDL